MKKYVVALLMGLTFISSGSLWAQHAKFGLSAGLVGSRYTIHNPKPEAGVVIRQGNIYTGATAGAFTTIRTSKDQPKSKRNDFKSYFKFEMNYCKCGGNVEVLQIIGVEEISKQEYRQDQLNLNFAYLAEVDKLWLMVGPTMAYNFKREVNRVEVGVQSTATKINELAFGGELGLGIKINSFVLSGRYYISLSEFAKPTAEINTAYNSHEARIVLSYIFSESNREKNWRSIYWK